MDVNQLSHGLDYYTYMKPLLYKKACGDICVTMESSTQVFVALLDVLGHGEEAYEVANRAKYFIESNYTEDLVDFVYSLHKDLLYSRGLVGSLMKLNIETGQLEYVGIGNIVSRVLRSQHYKFVNRDGVIGYNIPKPRVDHLFLDKGDIILMHSDGVKENSNLGANDDIFKQPASVITKEVVNKYSTGNDDSTCFLLKY